MGLYYIRLCVPVVDEIYLYKAYGPTLDGIKLYKAVCVCSG